MHLLLTVTKNNWHNDGVWHLSGVIYWYVWTNVRHLSSALVTTVNIFCLHLQDKQDMKNGEEPDDEGWVTIPVKKKNLKNPAKTKKQISKEEKKKRKENVSDI